MRSVYELCIFMTMIGNYEPGLVDIIFRFVKSYTFKTNKELYKGVNLWCKNREKAIKKYGHISYWDVSQITIMGRLFVNKKNFNDDISKWDVSNVTDMNHMFNNTIAFNQFIGNWDFSNVKNTICMFNGAESFDIFWFKCFINFKPKMIK